MFLVYLAIYSICESISQLKRLLIDTDYVVDGNPATMIDLGHDELVWQQYSVDLRLSHFFLLAYFNMEYIKNVNKQQIARFENVFVPVTRFPIYNSWSFY